MPFKCKSKFFARPIGVVVEKVPKDEMSDGCITHRIVKEIQPAVNNVPYSHGGIHHVAVTGEPVRQVSTQVLNPDRFEELANYYDNI